MTYDTMHDCVLAEEDDFARGADEPLPVLLGPGRIRVRIVQCELLDSAADWVRKADVVVRSERDSTGIDKGMLQVVNQIRRVLDTDAKTDKVLGQTSRCTSSRVNGCMSGDNE